MVSTEPKVDAREALREAMRQDPNLAEAVSELVADAAPAPLVLPGDWELTDERLVELSSLNVAARFEMEPDGSLRIMSPTHSPTGRLQDHIMRQVTVWSIADGRGEDDRSEQGYRLPRSVREPDGAWITREQAAAMWADRNREFTREIPPFVLEIRSISDRLAPLQAKMEEWVAAGVQLGWLVDPIQRTVHIYRGDGSIGVLEEPEELSGEDVLPGLVVEMASAWRML